MAKRWKTRKVVIIGAGHVGSHIALCLMYGHLVNEIVFLDVNQAAVEAQVMDLDDLASALGDSFIIRGGTYADCEDAHFVVNTAGRSRRPGESRLEMLNGTLKVLDGIVPELKESGFHGILINVSNPCDVITEYLYRNLGLPRTQVFGTGTSLDTARLRRILANLIGANRKQVQAFCMGEHGDSSFIPASHISVGGIPVKEYIAMTHQDVTGIDLNEIVREVRQAGGKIVKGKGCTEFGIASVVSEIIIAILHDEQRIMPLSVHLRGEYGAHDLSIGTPCMVGSEGIQEVLSMELTADEMARMTNSIDVIRKTLSSVNM